MARGGTRTARSGSRPSKTRMGGASGRSRTGGGATRMRPPIAGYDEMPLYQIREEAFALSPAEISALRTYEEKHARRETLLRTFQALENSGRTLHAPRARTRDTARATREGSGRAGSSKRTTDRQVIRRWAEERGGKPVSVRGTGRRGAAGVLRIDFEGYGAGSEDLRPISWDEFFRKFDENELEFIYQHRTRDGRESRFFKFVSVASGR